MQKIRNAAILALFLAVSQQWTFAQFSAVAVSPDGKVIAAGGAKGKICLWDTKTGAVLHEVKAAKAVMGLAFVRDVQTLVVGTHQGGVEIWTSKPDGYICAGQFGSDMIVYGVAVSADGKTLAASTHSGWTYLYETKTWKPVGVIFERSNLTSGVAFARDGSSLATAGNTFSLWNTGQTSALWKPRGDRAIDDIESATKLSRRWAEPTDQEVNDEVYCADVSISPDSLRVVGVNGTSRHDGGGKRLIAWEAATGKKMWTGRATGMTSVVFTSDGKRVATGSDDGVLRLWDPQTGKLLHEIQGHTKAVRNLAAMPEGADFVSAAQDGLVTLWDGKTGQRIREFRKRD